MLWQKLTRLWGAQRGNGETQTLQRRLQQRIQQQLAAGALAAAAASCRELLDIAPGDIDALNALGAIVSEQGDINAALEVATRLAGLEPGNPDHPMRAALFNSQLGRRDEARRLYLHALTLREDNVQVHALLSELELPGESYFDVLKRVHRHLRPRSYVEIGVFEGESLTFVHPEALAIGIDPEPQIKHPLAARTRVHAETSDAYFARHDVRAELGGLPVDLAFIDGMHQFEFALRDFINIERLCAPCSAVLIHDCYPLNRVTAEPERKTVFWSGDIWRLVVLLRRERPDLQVRTIAARPTGLALVTNLNPDSHLLSDMLAELIAEYRALDYSVLEAGKDRLLNRLPNDWAQIKACLPAPFSPAPAGP